jgi:hypothetical protein
MWSRRLQWPLIAVSLILCVALLGLAISGRRRAWWLIGLAPVLTLFVHRFLTSPINRYVVADEPACVAANDVTFLRDEDQIVGLVFNEQAYAYPYGCLAQSPLVVQTDREHRMLLMWSWRLEKATALRVTRDLKARELSITSEPAGALLIYNYRRGQFISATNGLTPNGAKPANIISDLKPIRSTWKAWRKEHPQTQVMLPIRSAS